MWETRSRSCDTPYAHAQICEREYVEVPSTLAAVAATVAVADSKKACDNKEHHGMSRYKR